jgi:WD40 repeat protein
MKSLAAASSFVLALVLLSVAEAAQAAPVSYETDIKPIFRRHCLKCHGDDMQKADLNLQSYASTIKGGSGGKVLTAGRTSQSLLFEAITNSDEAARMPPNSPPLADKEIELIRTWITEGLRENEGSEVKTQARDLSFKPAAATGAKIDVAMLMPADLPTVTPPKTVRPLPALAMDVSPYAPLAAVAGQEFVRLINTETKQEIGRLPFPEGVPHVIKFHRDGAVLLVAGGKPVQSGKVVLFDVHSGKRLAALGDELDAVLAADISPDQKLVALGGSGKVVKVFSTTDGALKYKLTKHTDWITAVSFSPDGAKLATADRTGGLHLWEAEGGGIILTLAEHKGAIRAMQWRSDSKLLATAGEDGLLIWWDTKDGWPAVSKPNAHPPIRPAGTYGEIKNGILSAGFGPSGHLLTAGRDNYVRYWDPAGNPVKSWPVEKSLPLSTRITADGKTLIAGDTSGELHFWPAP